MKFFKIGYLAESHASELCHSLNFKGLSPWLTPESAMLHVIESVIKKAKPLPVIYRKWQPAGPTRRVRPELRPSLAISEKLFQFQDARLVAFGLSCALPLARHRRKVTGKMEAHNGYAGSGL